MLLLLSLFLWTGLASLLSYGFYRIWRARQQGVCQALLYDEFKEKLVVITGGSSGLGREVARRLAEAGTILVLIARGRKLLEDTRAELVNQVKGARVFTIAVDVTDAQATAEAMEQAAHHHPDRVIYALFCCAGAAEPGFFIESPPSIFAQQMSLNYSGAVNCVHPVVRLMVDHRIKGRIVLISSTLGLTGMIGYSPYSPSKFALRGLAECLRQELLPYGIRVHIYFVATIASPGHERENQAKPAITKKIEEGDISDPSPAARAHTLLAGILCESFFISSDLLTSIFLAASLGSAPSSRWLWDALMIPWAHWGLAIWRAYADRLVLQHTVATPRG